MSAIKQHKVLDPMVALARKNILKHNKYETPFAIGFGVPLSKFWDKITGFDILKFNDWIGAGDRCLEDVVLEKYGEDAPSLIRSLF